MSPVRRVGRSHPETPEEHAEALLIAHGVPVRRVYLLDGDLVCFVDDDGKPKTARVRHEATGDVFMGVEDGWGVSSDEGWREGR